MNRPPDRTPDGAPDGAYVERVCRRAVAELDRFLSGTGPARNGARLQVRVTITTGLRLAAEQRRLVDGQLERVRANYGWAQYRAIFSVNPGLGEPTCEVTLWEPDDRLPPTSPPPSPPPRYAVLTLRYESLTFAYVLTSGKRWVTLHRPDRAHPADPGTDIVVPAAMSGVPTGPLLAIWYQEPHLGVQRLSHRPEIGITVGADLLPIGHYPEIPWSGTIGYADPATGRTTTLDYRLEKEWSELPPSPSTAPPGGDGHPHRVVLSTGATEIALDVQPPAAGASPVERRFPLPAPAQPAPGLDGPSHHDIRTWVLYTRATGADGSGHWHVKLFRCATEWHARLLRTYLRNQAVLIDRVNRRLGGSPLRPPWAIAPVHVLPAVPSTAGPPPPTDYHPDPEDIITDPENRLAGWFGAPDQPQPDCYVVVVSPELTRVTWRPRRDSPGREQLRLLQSMAQALDLCHELGVAHGDIKPENVCFSDLQEGYVLVDGDSVTPLDAVRPALRFTERYASQAMIKRAAGTLAPGRSRLPSNDVLLTEHDRFGFVLVVLTVLAGSELVSGLLRRDENGDRDVDHAERVREMLTSGWPGEWGPLVAVLTAPFERDALAASWSAAQWLRDLDTAYEESVRPPPDPSPVPSSEQPYDTEIREILARLHQRGPLPRPDLRDAVTEEVRAARRSVAAQAQAWAFFWWGLCPVAVAALILLAAILGI